VIGVQAELIVTKKLSAKFVTRALCALEDGTL
jgi:hypothetical protein